MSIIHEALKKADRDKGKVVHQPGRFNGGLAVVVTVLLVTGGLILSPLTRKGIHTSEPSPANWIPGSPASVPGATSPNVQAQFGIEEMPRGMAFAVSGIVAGGPGKSYAIINNQVVAAGQKIGGGIVESISDTAIVVDVNGQKVNLPISDPNRI